MLVPVHFPLKVSFHVTLLPVSHLFTFCAGALWKKVSPLMMYCKETFFLKKEKWENYVIWNLHNVHSIMYKMKNIEDI